MYIRNGVYPNLSPCHEETAILTIALSESPNCWTNPSKWISGTIHREGVLHFHGQEQTYISREMNNLTFMTMTNDIF